MDAWMEKVKVKSEGDMMSSRAVGVRVRMTLIVALLGMIQHNTTRASSSTTVSKAVVTRLPGFPADLPFKLETGYIGVGEDEQVQLFYYYFESQRNPAEDPLLLWISGGPGCSTVRAIFYEIGPLNFKASSFSSAEPELELNPYSWTKVANVIFVDQPVGTGFSYAKVPEASRSDDMLSAEQTYDFLKKWLMEHPEFLSNPLYISGTSYAGIIVPNIVVQIYSGNERGDVPQMNIKGYILGNPLTDKKTDINYRVEYAHRFALLSDELYESAKRSCHGNYIEMDSSNRLCGEMLGEVNKCVERINFPQILEPECGLTLNRRRDIVQWANRVDETPIKLLTTSAAPFVQMPRQCRSDEYVLVTIWANEEEVRRALHIREGTIDEWVRCNLSMQYSFGLNETTSYSFNVEKTVDYHDKLLGKNCRALIYSGDHDMVVPYLATRKWIRGLNLSVESVWNPWFVETQVAGYSEKYMQSHYSLTFSTVKGGGHTGAEYKPKECLAMVDRWLAYEEL